MADVKEVIDGLKALEQSMQSNQCYACSYEFIDTVDNFGDNIIQEAIELLEQMDIVRCKDCRQNNQCSIQFKFAYADNPGEWFCANGKHGDKMINDDAVFS